MATIVTSDQMREAKAKLDKLSLYDVGLLLTGLDYLIEVEENDEEEHGVTTEILDEARQLRAKLGR